MNKSLGKVQNLKRLYANRRFYRLKLLRFVRSHFMSGANRLIWELGLFVGLVCAMSFMSLRPPILGHVDSAAIEVFSVIAGALASILGIAVAFVLVSFELSRRYFSAQYSARKLFKSEALRELVILYSATILVSVGGLVSIHISHDALANWLICLSCYLFILSILILIPRVRSIVLQEDARKEVERIARRINSTQASQFVRMNGNPYAVSHSEGNPLNDLAVTGTKAVSGGDSSLSSHIVESLFWRFKEITDGRPDDHMGWSRDIINGFSYVVTEVGKEAIKKEDTKTLRTAFYYLVEMLLIYSDQKKVYYQSLEAEDRMEELIRLSIQRNLTELTRTMIFKLRLYFENQIKVNAPLESELWEFNMDKRKTDEVDTEIDYDRSNHWHHLSDKYTGMMVVFAEESIKRRDEETLRVSLSAINDMCYFVMSQPHLGDGQKRRMTSLGFYKIKSTYEQAVKEQFIKKNWFILSSMSNSFTTANQVATGKDYAVIGLRALADAFVFAAQHDALDTFPLNELGTTGRSLVRHITDVPLTAQAVMYIADTLATIGGVVSADLSTPNKAQIYVECYSQISSLKRWMLHEGIKNTQVSYTLNKELRLFSDLDKAKEVADQSNADRWNSLFGDKKKKGE